MAEEKSELQNQNMTYRSMDYVFKFDKIVYLHRKICFFQSRLYYCYKSFTISKSKHRVHSNLNRYEAIISFPKFLGFFQ